ncbi:MAG: hypothetical protein MUP97_01490 [Acidimicrobiia bacterium]|jgi:hypothetical protein|nr:hypothetical protein [Acidimicrobiia bacterium]
METPKPSQPNQPPTRPTDPSVPEPTAPSTDDRDRDLVTLGGLEAEFTDLEHELERVDRPGAGSAEAEAPAS